MKAKLDTWVEVAHIWGLMVRMPLCHTMGEDLTGLHTPRDTPHKTSTGKTATERQDLAILAQGGPSTRAAQDIITPCPSTSPTNETSERSSIRKSPVDMHN